MESPLQASELGASLMELTADTKLSLKMVSSRGTKVFPPTGAITDTLDHWRARFIIKENPGDLPDDDVHELLAAHLQPRPLDARSGRNSRSSTASCRLHARPGGEPWGVSCEAQRHIGSGDAALTADAAETVGAYARGRRPG